MRGIFFEHPAGAELGNNGTKRFLRHLNPSVWNAGLITIVKQGNNLLLKHAVHGLGIWIVVVSYFKILRRITDSPPIVAVVAFIPPAVEYADIDHSIHSGFLAAGATCFQWSARVVEPYIDALRKEMRRVQFIVLDESDVTSQSVLGSQ